MIIQKVKSSKKRTRVISCVICARAEQAWGVCVACVRVWGTVWGGFAQASYMAWNLAEKSTWGHSSPLLCEGLGSSVTFCLPPDRWAKVQSSPLVSDLLLSFVPKTTLLVFYESLNTDPTSFWSSCSTFSHPPWDWWASWTGAVLMTAVLQQASPSLWKYHVICSYLASLRRN
jgi:hypothetical protein